MSTLVQKSGTTAIKSTKEDRIFNIIVYTILTFVALIILYPLYFILIASFSSPELVSTGQVVLFPQGINFSGYNRIINYSQIWQGFAMTIYYTVLGTLFNLCLTMPAAYVITRKSFLARGLFTKFLLFTMFFNGGLIPTYLLVDSIGLYNTPVTLILLNGVNVFNLIIAKSTIQNTIPEEMYEAASIDGCNHFRYFFSFILPLSKSIIAVITLYYGVAHWNNYMAGLLYLSDSELYPLQLILRNILIEGEILAQSVESAEEAIVRQQETELMKYGLIIISSAPLLGIFPFIQKYFTRGTMIGSVKG